MVDVPGDEHAVPFPDRVQLEPPFTLRGQNKPGSDAKVSFSDDGH
jgi:hypothetical protein